MKELKKQLKNLDPLKSSAHLFFWILFVNLVFFLALIVFGKPFFATNDDFRMRLIVSGRYSGTPNGQAIFLNVLLGYLLSALYTIAPAVEWYGLYLEFSIFVSVIMAEFVFLKRISERRELIIRSVIIAIFSALLFEKQILMPQFTTVSAFLVSAAVSCVIELLNEVQNDESIKTKYCVLSVLFIIFSCLTRGLVTLMILPVYFSIGIIIFLLIRNKSKSPRKIIYMLICAAVATITIRGAQLINLYYGENKDYYAFSTARASIVDYGGFPDYSENQELYESLNISYSEYVALIDRNYDVSENITTEALQALKNNGIRDAVKLSPWKEFGNRINVVFNTFLGSEVRFSFLAAFIAVLLASVCSKENKLIHLGVIPLFILYFFCACTGFALYGRLIARLAESFCILAVFISVSILGGYFSCGNVLEYKKENILMLSSIMLVISELLLVNQYALQAESGSIRPNIRRKTKQLDALREYANRNSDNFYFYNTNDFIAASEFLFMHSNAFENIDCMGMWYVHSELYEQRNRNLGFKSPIDAFMNNSNCFYAEIGNYHSGMDLLLKEKGYEFEKVDTVFFEDIEINIYKAVSIPEVNNNQEQN